jgi:anaerobic magnesium-protoporphyrin IX monomethyl ester cyclase
MPSSELAVSLDVLLVNLYSTRNRWVLHPPLGLAYLASALERDGFRVEILDANCPPRFPGLQLLQEIARRSPAIVGLTLYTPDLASFGALLPGLQRLRRHGAFEHLVLGGPHPTHHPAIVQEVGCRWAVVGDAEVSFPALCRALLRGQGHAEQLPGVIAVRDGQSRINPAQGLPPLDELAPPARHLLDGDAYFNPLTACKVTSAIMARGCPYQCSFCCGATETSKLSMRYRQVDRILEELRVIRDVHGVGYVEFVDETFTIKRSLVVDVCEGMKGMGLAWGCQTRADRVDAELLQLMASAGCEKVAYGIDAGTEAIRVDVAGKALPDQLFRDVFAWTRDAGIRTVANIIFGFPGEGRADAELALEFVRSLQPTFANFQPLAIFPATRIYEQALELGKIDEGLWGRTARAAEGDMPLYEQPERGMDDAWLRRFGRSTIWRFYLRPDQVLRLVQGSRPREIVHRAGIALSMARYHFLEGAR